MEGKSYIENGRQDLAIRSDIRPEVGKEGVRSFAFAAIGNSVNDNLSCCVVRTRLKATTTRSKSLTE